MKKILITGIDGTIGQILNEGLKNSYEIFGLDIKSTGADITDINSLENFFNELPKIDCVIHLAGDPFPKADWDNALSKNIIGTKHIFEMAEKFKIPKVVLASSTHAFGDLPGYPTHPPRGVPVNNSSSFKPDGFYGLSKACCELIAQTYFDLHEIHSIIIRLGHIPKDNVKEKDNKLFLSHEDCVQVFAKAVETKIPYGAYFATSKIEDPYFDISRTEEDLSYRPAS